MTMHGSKGLEFKAVFIVDANQGIIPTSKALRRGTLRKNADFFMWRYKSHRLFKYICGEERLGCPIEVSMFVEEML